MFIYFERERHSASRRGEEREGVTESKAGSRLWAVSTEPDMGHELTNREIMTWAEVGHLTDWATQVPLKLNFFLNKFFFMFIYFWQRETEHELGRGRERGRHRIWSRLQALSCQHRARHGARTHRPLDHDLSRSRTLNWLSHPGAPRNHS